MSRQISFLKKISDRQKGIIVIAYSCLHYILFGFDIWVITFLVLGGYWILKKSPSVQKNHIGENAKQSDTQK
jgi:hypothetical protein